MVFVYCIFNDDFPPIWSYVMSFKGRSNLFKHSFT